MVQRQAKDWSPTQKWIAGVGATALLAFGAFVGVGATKSYQIPNIERKVEKHDDKLSKQGEQYGRIEATLQSVLDKLDRIENKVDRHMEQKPFDKPH